MKKIVYVLGICLIVIGGHYMYKATKVKNVFDEMYYAEVQSLPKLYTSTSYSGLIKENILKKLQKNVRDFYPDFKKEYYESNALNKGEDISLNFYNDKEGRLRKFEVIGIKEFHEDNDVLRFYFIYNIDAKELIIKKPDIVSDKYSDTDYSTNDPNEIEKFMKKHDLTKEDIAEYQDYFLYKKVLTDWIVHNPSSRFSLEQFGKVEIIKEK